MPMIDEASTTALISHAIQLAIAPVFLLTGVAGLLGVMATRLSRVIDRGRDLAQRWDGMSDNARNAVRIEADYLERRRHLCSWSINLCTSAALLVCLVIVTLFVETFFFAHLKWAAVFFFIAAMLALIGGLSCFLREVYLATHTVNIELAAIAAEAAQLKIVQR